jgi:hypothetical protein
MRGRLLLAVPFVVVLVACTSPTGNVSQGRSTPPPPAQARDAVVTLLTGDRQQLIDALSPPLAASLPSGEPTQRGGPAEVTLTDWRQQGNFALAIALVRQSGADARLTVGFRQVDGKWRITLAEPGQQ